MGMFDDIEVLYDLPRLPADHDRQFQTKSLICWLEKYRIDQSGVLWHQDYDIEDRSDPTATDIRRFAGMMTRVNQRWVRDSYTGEVEFHDFDDGVWMQYRAWFREGQLRDVVADEAHEPEPAGSAPSTPSKS